MASTRAAAAAPAVTARRSFLLALAVGAGGAVIGLVPGLIGGGRLPLQNLWATPVLPEDMPFALLPVSQYHVTTILSLLVVGGVVAGLGLCIARSRAPLGRAPAALAHGPAALGLAAVHLVAITQTFAILADGLRIGSGDLRALLYFVGMLAVALIAAGLGQLGLWLAAHRSAGAAALGVALAAVPFAAWLSFGVNAVSGPGGMPFFMVEVVRWVPAVIVGAALVWCGVRPPRRLAVWAGALLALWLLPALFGAIQYGLGMRVLQGDPGQMAEAAGQVFPLMLAEGSMPVLVAAVIGVVGVVIRSSLRPAVAARPLP